MKLPRLQILNLISSIVIGSVGSVVIVRMLLAGDGRNPSIWIFVVLTLFSLGTALKLALSMYQARKNRIQIQKHQAALAKNKSALGGRASPSDSERNHVKERPMPVPLSRDRNGRSQRR